MERQRSDQHLVQHDSYPGQAGAWPSSCPMPHRQVSQTQGMPHRQSHTHNGLSDTDIIPCRDPHTDCRNALLYIHLTK